MGDRWLEALQFLVGCGCSLSLFFSCSIRLRSVMSRITLISIHLQWIFRTLHADLSGEGATVLTPVNRFKEQALVIGHSKLLGSQSIDAWCTERSWMVIISNSS